MTDDLVPAIRDLNVLMVDRQWRGGLMLYTQGLCRHMAELCPNVTLLTATAYPRELDSMPYRIARRLQPMRMDLTPAQRLRWMTDRLRSAVHNSRARNRYVRNNPDIDIVHLQTANALVDQYLLRPLARRVPVVVTVHDTIPHGKGKFVERREFMKRTLRHCDRIIVHYAQGRQNLVDRFQLSPDLIDVVPHGLTPADHTVDPAEARARLGLPREKTILLFFGSVRPDKGLRTLLHAMAASKDVLRDTLLVVAGSVPRGADFGEYDRLIAALDLEDHVARFVRFIEEAEVADFFGACDVVALPYDQFDSQSGVLMQAYIHHKPVLTTDVGAIPELVLGDGVGVVARPADADSLAAALREILVNLSTYAGCCGPDTTNKYSWTSSARQTLACYHRVLEQRRGVGRQGAN